MFESMGGSAPKNIGTGKINPIAAINAVSMMLDQLGETKAAARVVSSQFLGILLFATSIARP